MPPKLKLSINKKQDLQNAHDFLWNLKSEPQFVYWFFPKQLHFILEEKFTKIERLAVIKAYTDNFYQEHSQEIREKLQQTKQNWKKIEKSYFQIVAEIFNNHPWPKGDYRGFVSIFNMFPRDIKNKIFYLPYKNRQTAKPLPTIAHELLHFIFFDYVAKKFKQKECFEPNNYLWQVSEVFNNVIESWQPYKKLIKGHPKPYPGTEKMFLKMKKQWDKKQDINWLLSQWF